MDRNFLVSSSISSIFVAPRRGAWIEIPMYTQAVLSVLRRTPQGCVDRNQSGLARRLGSKSRTPQGCVDRNTQGINSIAFWVVAPRRGAWIEIFLQHFLYHVLFVAPRRGAWIEIFVQKVALTKPLVAPRRGAWIEIPKSQ